MAATNAVAGFTLESSLTPPVRLMQVQGLSQQRSKREAYIQIRIGSFDEKVKKKQPRHKQVACGLGKKGLDDEFVRVAFIELGGESKGSKRFLGLNPAQEETDACLFVLAVDRPGAHEESSLSRLTKRAQSWDVCHNETETASGFPLTTSIILTHSMSKSTHDIMVMARFGLVMVSSEMHSALTLRIYKNGVP